MEKPTEPPVAGCANYLASVVDSIGRGEVAAECAEVIGGGIDGAIRSSAKSAKGMKVR